MKFAHLGDCHLGGWRQPELQELNMESFRTAIEKCIKEKCEFVIIAGDLFDTAYPSIDTLKDAFNEFRKLKDEKIPVFLIAGSHDFSASGKTFLDVLEKAGLCKNISLYEERNELLLLEPTIYKNVALYGYSGKKSGLETEDIERIKLNDAPGMFKILMLHTAIRDAIGNIPVDAVDEKKLPKVDYLALGHLHIHYNKEGRVYSGPIFPNNLSELTDLKYGSFYLFDNGKITKQSIKLKEVAVFDIDIQNALTATDEIIEKVKEVPVNDKIVIIRLSGILEVGKISDIQFQKVNDLLKEKGAYIVVKSTTKLFTPESDIDFNSADTASLEQEIITKFESAHPSKFNTAISSLISAFQLEKQDEEKSATFESRLLNEAQRILEL